MGTPWRAVACDESAETLAWRAVSILDTMYQSIDTNKPIPPHLLNSIVNFEQCVELVWVSCFHV
jgi:hypothetical protein